MAKKQITRIKGIDDLQAKLRAMSKIGRGAVLTGALTAGAVIIQAEAAKNAAYLSGTLRRSVAFEIKQSGSKTTARIGTNLVYGAQREFGGVIKAKSAPYLVFQINGTWIRVKQVTQRAQPWLRPAFEDKQAEAVGEIITVLVSQLARIAQ